jgi:ankyrin repeat protein
MAIVGSSMTANPHDLGDESSTSLLKQDESILIRELFSSVRYGMKTQVAAFLSNYPQLANLTDNQGFSCVHWASKNGDRDMLKILADAGALLDQRTVSEAKMMPIHWAASDGKISSLSFFLERRQDINAQDANGCTPVIIAAQHNQLDCVIYLIKNGADTTLRDTNGDNALHWGAYKGYVEMVGLLTYLLPHELDSEDIFGQVKHLFKLISSVPILIFLLITFM